MIQACILTLNKKKYNGFIGHPGPSKVAKEIACKKMRLFGAVGHNNIFCKKKIISYSI